jgi:hypothetical protein
MVMAKLVRPNGGVKSARRIVTIPNIIGLPNSATNTKRKAI